MYWVSTQVVETQDNYGIGLSFWGDSVNKDGDESTAWHLLQLCGMVFSNRRNGKCQTQALSWKLQACYWNRSSKEKCHYDRHPALTVSSITIYKLRWSLSVVESPNSSLNCKTYTMMPSGKIRKSIFSEYLLQMYNHSSLSQKVQSNQLNMRKRAPKQVTYVPIDIACQNLKNSKWWKSFGRFQIQATEE